MKNPAASVHARLAQRRTKTGEDYNMLLVRFTLERLLYRLSRSSHREQFDKTVVVPNIGERNYFARLRTLAYAKKLTITKITPVDAEWVFGTAPTNDVPC